MTLKNICTLIFLIVSLVRCTAQTFCLKGSISNFDSGQILNAHLAKFDGNAFTEYSSATITKEGNFQMYLKDGISPSACLLWFDSGDTISIVAGCDSVITFKGRMYEKAIVEPAILRSNENTQFLKIKETIRQFKKFEDSLNHASQSIDDYDKNRSTKTAAVNNYYLKCEKDYNNTLRSIKATNPKGYCSRAIIPVIMRVSADMDTALSNTYDNNRAFQHYEFFRLIGNDSLIATNPYLEEKIFNYMNYWVGQKDAGLQQGIDNVVSKFADNEMVRKYALATLVDYFTSHNNYMQIILIPARCLY